MKRIVKNILVFVLAVTMLILAGAAGSTETYAASGSWKQNSKGWWYEYSDGSYAAGTWERIGGKWYHFSDAGYMQTGWIKDGGKWYYLAGSGAMQTGWVKSGGKWYYMNSSGVMQTGWVKSDTKWYYMNSSGVMQTGWVKSGGKWYYMNGSGVMQTGWLKQGGKWYYLNSSGAMVTGTRTIGGKTYTFGENGVWNGSSTSGTDSNWKQIYKTYFSSDFSNKNVGFLDVDNNGVPELFVMDMGSATAAITMYYIQNSAVKSFGLYRLGGVAGNEIYSSVGLMVSEYQVRRFENGNFTVLFMAKSSGNNYYVNNTAVTKEAYLAALQEKNTYINSHKRTINYTTIQSRSTLHTLINNY